LLFEQAKAQLCLGNPGLFLIFKSASIARKSLFTPDDLKMNSIALKAPPISFSKSVIRIEVVDFYWKNTACHISIAQLYVPA
jgi:hypothetical protein